MLFSFTIYLWYLHSCTVFAKVDYADYLFADNGAIAFGGSTIGDNAEIGTNAVVAGIPAKIIKIRDEESNSR